MNLFLKAMIFKENFVYETIAVCTKLFLKNDKYSQTSVFERLGVRTIRFSNRNFKIIMTRYSNKNLVLEQLFLFTGIRVTVHSL